MSSCVDVVGCDVAQSFVVAPIIIVLDKGLDRFLQLTRHVIRHLVYLPFKSAVISFYLAIRLGMERRGGSVPYPHQFQVLIELPSKRMSVKLDAL